MMRSVHNRGGGLALRPFRALRPVADRERLGRLLCPPYDVIGPGERAALLAGDADNAVGLILPQSTEGTDPYRAAADHLDGAVSSGRWALDPDPALYVYEMSPSDGPATRGLLGAVQLRDPADAVILPHENTMAGPVADRLALMTATEANLEPIYLVYDGGGAASDMVSQAGRVPPLAEARTADGITHRLWALTDAAAHRAVAADLATRRALIADGHHRYATYLRMQRQLTGERGPGPWDWGLTLLVDSSSHGPQVHAIHRVLVGVPMDDAVARCEARLTVTPITSVDEGLRRAAAVPGFAVVLSAAGRSCLVTDPAGSLHEASARDGEPPEMADLDVTVLHRGLVGAVLGIGDSVDRLGYAHTVAAALDAAAASDGTAVLLRPTPISAITAVAAHGARMPRKSTLFTPKPASGMVIRRFRDELA